MKISAVYCILNTQNNKRYIGSSFDFTKRKKSHLYQLKKNTHHSVTLQRAYNKYGENNFVFIILQECDRERLLEIEQFYLDSLKPEYNISKDSYAPMKGRKHRPETIEKFRKIKRRTGKRAPWSEEARKNHLKARIGKKRSLEFKERRRKEALEDERAKYILGVNDKKIKSSEGIIFKSLTEAAKYYNMSRQAVCDNLKGRSNATRAGIRFEYVS